MSMCYGVSRKGTLPGEEGRPFGAHRASKTADEDLLAKTVHALTATRFGSKDDSKAVLRMRSGR